MPADAAGTPELIWIFSLVGSAVPWLGLLNTLTGDKDKLHEKVEGHQETLLRQRAHATVDLFKSGEKLLIFSGDPTYGEGGGDEPPKFAVDHWRGIEKISDMERTLRARRSWYDGLHSVLVSLIIIGVLNQIAFAFIAIRSGAASVPEALAIIGLAIAAAATFVIGGLHFVSTRVTRLSDDPVFRAGG